MFSTPRLMIAAGALLAVAACSQQPSLEAEQKAVRDQSAKLQTLIAAHDAAGIAELYADDGVFMPPNSPEVKGKDDLTRAWTAMLNTPGFNYQLSSDKLEFATSADVATDLGRYQYSAGNGGATASDQGKSVISWVKRDGQWKILAHAYSSNQPIVPPTPTVPPEAITPPPSDATAPPTETTPGVTTPPATLPPPASTPTTPPTTPPATPTNP